MAHWDCAQGQAKMAKKSKSTPTCDVSPRKPQSQNEKIYFYFDSKTCWIRRGFEQLSSSSGWRFKAKKGGANMLARVVVKGLKSCNFSKNWKCILCCAPNAWIWLCFPTQNQFCMVNSAIYSIGSYDFFVNTPPCCIINEQQLQWAAYVVP